MPTINESAAPKKHSEVTITLKEYSILSAYYLESGVDRYSTIPDLDSQASRVLDAIQKRFESERP